MNHGPSGATFTSAGIRTGVTIALLTVVVAAAYSELLSGLVRQWAQDDNYSHGFVIGPLAAYFAWQRRHALTAAPSRPDSWGLVLILVGLALWIVGIAAAVLFIARVSLIVVIAGCVWFFCGLAHLRLLRFPVLFLLLMIPLPAVVFNQIAFPLQLLASHAGEVTLRASGIPVLRDGNVLELEALRLEVAEACSGIRSVVSLLTFALVFAHFNDASRQRMWLLAIATVPIAIGVNAARIAGTGVASHFWGPAVAEGFLHTASGMLVFLAAAAALVVLTHAGHPQRMRTV